MKWGRGTSDNDFSLEILVIDSIKKTFDTFLPASRYRTTILPTYEIFKTVETCQKRIRLEAKRQNDLTRRQKIVELSDLHENLEKNLINNR